MAEIIKCADVLERKSDAGWEHQAAIDKLKFEGAKLKADNAMLEKALTLACDFIRNGVQLPGPIWQDNTLTWEEFFTQQAQRTGCIRRQMTCGLCGKDLQPLDAHMGYIDGKLDAYHIDCWNAEPEGRKITKAGGADE